MNPRQFLVLAENLAQRGGAAEQRSAISRGYYAVYNVAEAFLERMGFQPPKKDGHVMLQHRLLNSGDRELEKLGSDLGNFHVRRNRADYKMTDKACEHEATVRASIVEAKRMIETLDACPIYGERWNQIKA